MSAPSTIVTDEPLSGNVLTPPKLAGITEIRVHGVGGSTPATLLKDPSPQQVSGDRIAGFYRTKDRRDRHIEAYSWGGLTSRSRARVLWLLLLPFMLANVAGWMAEPRTPPSAVDQVRLAGRENRTKKDRSSGRKKVPRQAPTSLPYRWAARVAALAVTGNVLTIITLGTVDVAAYQCGGSPSCANQGWWLAPLTWDSLPDHPSRRILVGALVACAAIAILALLSYTSRRRYERIEPPKAAVDTTGQSTPAAPARKGKVKKGKATGTRSATAAALPLGLEDPNFWAGKDSHARLSRLHLAFAVTTVSLIVLYCARSTTAPTNGSVMVDSIVWPLTWGVGIAVLLAVLLFVGNEPKNQWSSGLLVAGSLLCFAGAAWFAWVQPPAKTTPGHLPGLQDAFFASWLLTLAMLVPLLLWPVMQWLYRRSHGLKGRGHSARFGWGAPFVVAATGIVVADIVLLAMVVAFAKVLGTPVWADVADPTNPMPNAIYLYPSTSLAITLIVLCSGAIILGAAGIGLIAFLRAGATPQATRLRDDLAEEYATIDPKPEQDAELRKWWESAIESGRDPADKSPWPKISGFIRSIARWRFLAKHITRVLYVLTVLVAVAVILVVLIHTGRADWIESNISVLTPLMITVAALLPPVILGFMWRSWSRVENRKAIGVLWDVGTFWPRSFHPFAPPSYAERAVPELLRRIWWLSANEGRVLLAGHSQGSMLSFAAMVRRPERKVHADCEVALATFGSPLQKLYRWAFPAYLPDELLVKLSRGDGGVGRVNWRNFYYLTDVIGGPAVPRSVTAGASTPCRSVDFLLPDPSTSKYIFGQPEPQVAGHSGYWEDRVMWKQVDEMAEELRAELQPPLTAVHHEPRQQGDGGRPGDGQPVVRPPAAFDQEPGRVNNSTRGGLRLVKVLSLLPFLAILFTQLYVWRRWWFHHADD